VVFSATGANNAAAAGGGNVVLVVLAAVDVVVAATDVVVVADSVVPAGVVGNCDGVGVADGGTIVTVPGAKRLIRLARSMAFSAADLPSPLPPAPLVVDERLELVSSAADVLPANKRAN
jgi:hypothetical protein